MTKNIKVIYDTHLFRSVGWQAVLEDLEDIVDVGVPSVENRVPHRRRRVAHDGERLLKPEPDKYISM